MASENLRDAFRAFTTTCALITTDGPRGPNVMAAEWTFNVSYRPFLILVAIDPGNRTHDMILEAKEFGVNLVTEDQVAAMGFAGHFSKADTDKLSSELFETVPAQKIHAPMIRGSLLQAECRLVQTIALGDHTGFVGEVIEFSVDPEGKPLILHHGSRQLGERIVRNPGVVLAGTPMTLRPGVAVLVSGELTGGLHREAPVSVELRDAAGAVVAATSTRSTADGDFQVRIAMPELAAHGVYRLVARAEGAEGAARVRVE